MSNASPRRLLIPAQPWLVSLLLHAGVLLAMALWIYPSWVGDAAKLVIRGGNPNGESTFDLQPVSIAVLELPEPRRPSVEPLLDPLPPPTLQTLRPTDLQPAVLASHSGAELAKALTPEAWTADPSTAFLSEAFQPSEDDRESTELAPSIAVAGDVAAASGAVERAIRRELAKGDTLVVWLLDASISLQLNRQRMAARMERFYRSIDALDRQTTSSHTLFSSVVAFGRSTVEVQPPSPRGAKAVAAMTRIPIDPTGKEQTFAAVQQVVQRYRTKQGRDERFLIVLLTDESGDDGVALEQTIDQCRGADCAVHVLGPTAVLGAEEGLQRWTAEQNGRSLDFLLTVRRGPEAARPERLLLPYWHELSLPAWKAKVRPAVTLPWFGSEYREGVPSGFGPYTLTRLALQTGGSFTRFDGGDGERYDLTKLKDYVPEYDTVAEYDAAIQEASADGDRLREFVLAAASFSRQHAETFRSPRTLFLSQRSEQFPFEPVSIFLAPAQFRPQFAKELRQEMKRVTQAVETLEAFMRQYDAESWVSSLGREMSPRWRANFDLTYGRLMAARVRHREYLTLGQILLSAKPHPDNPLQPTDPRRRAQAEAVNHVALLPDSRLRHPESEGLVGLAEAHLRRCVSEHAGTPWADLARWELEKAFGVQARGQRLVRLPTAGSSSAGRSGSGGGGFSFPSL